MRRAMNLDGKTVLLTGATGGIGQATARRLTAAGAHLVITGRRGEVLEALARELGARAVAGDLPGHGVGVSVVRPGFVRDAGMFADAAHSLPWFVATVSPEAVAKGIVRAIRRNRSELTVAPLTLRLFAAGGSLPPVLVPMINRR